jgi:hypothetical protein
MKDELIDEKTLKDLMQRFKEASFLMRSMEMNVLPVRLGDGQITLAMVVEQPVDGHMVATPLFFLQTEKGYGEKVLGLPDDPEFKNYGTSESTTADILAGKPSRVQ